MKKNMGKTDKTIRILVAVILIGISLAFLQLNTLGIVLLVIAGIFILTSVVSFCPLYTIIGINTCERKK
jgi:uncharacterized membrane protein YadS